MEWCVQDGVMGLVKAENFRGFRPKIYSPTSGFSQQTFGVMNSPDIYEKCYTANITEEIMYFTVYYDENDVEGIVLEGYKGTLYSFRANGLVKSPRERLGGRPIGFRVWMGKGGVDNQPILVAIVYNSCNCPASSFMLNAQPKDMTIQAVVGAPVVQDLPYQHNYMEFIYGQNCGDYQITFSPPLALLNLSVSGVNKSPNGKPFIDKLTLTSTSVNDIGVYNLKMVIGQDTNNSAHGFHQPYRGFVKAEQYNFKVTVSPCVITAFTNSASIASVSLDIKDPLKQTSAYAFTQSPQCGYTVDITVTGLPAFVTHNSATKDFSILANDDSNVGLYTIEVTGKISVPNDATKSSYTSWTQKFTFQITVQPCRPLSNNQLEFVSNMNYAVGSASETSTTYLFKSSPDCLYAQQITVTGLPAFAADNRSTRNFSVPQTSNLSLVGSYSVTVQASVSYWSDYTKSTKVAKSVQQTFTIFMHPCAIISFSSKVTVASIKYYINTATLTAGQYAFEQNPLCGYPETITVTGLPAFASHNAVPHDFTVPATSDLALIGVYPVTLRSEISVPNDYTKTSYTKHFVQYSFDLRMEPCQITSYKGSPVVSDLLYTVGQPGVTSGSYGFVQTPGCGYQETLTVTGVVATWITHNTGTKNFSVAKTTNNSASGAYPITIKSQISVPDNAEKSSFTPHIVEYTFTIYITPCQVSTYVQSAFVGAVTYSIATPGISTPSFRFDESPVCNYPKTETVTSLPAFMVYDKQNAKFNLPQTADLSIIGIYSFVIRSEIEVPNDYTMATKRIMFKEETVTVRINPCQVSTYTATKQVVSITYRIGDPDLIDGAYAFSESPICGYPETVTVTNLPSWAIHLSADKKFKIPSTRDLALIGSYTVTMRGEISMPNDASKVTYSSKFVQYNFMIYMEPCKVTTYADTVKVTKLEYFIGTPTITDGHYAFKQTPFCGYLETVTVSNVPAFAVHNAGTADFTVPGTANLELIGEYTVTLKSAITVPNDHTKASSTTLFVEYSFPLRMQPCIVNTYTRSLVAGPIVYNIGAPTLVSPKYSFDEEPACYYPETVTVKNLPPFATHDEAASEFTIAKNTDLSIIGSYTVTLRSEISVPTDYTKTSFTKKFVEYDFLILIEPCLVNSYVATTTVTEILYNIGAPSKTDGRYGFDEAPVCNYPEKVTVTNLPAFAKHNPATSDFTVPQTTNLALLGEYIVTLRSEICVPNDHTKAACKTMFVEYDFRILVNPCIVNTYTDTKRVGDISYNIGAPSLINVGKYIFQESPVCNYPETVTLTNLPAFIKHQEPTSDFTLPQNTDLALIGSYVVTIRSSISKPDDYRGATFTQMFVEYTFTIFVEPCLVTSYVATLEVADIRYNIGGASLLNVSPYIFDEAPVCNYPETVTLTNLPTFARHNAPASDDFSLPKTANLALLGAYTVKIKSQIEVPNDHTKTSFKTWSAEHEFVIYIEPCLVASYDATTIVTVIVYNVNQPTLTAGHYQFDETPVCKYPETVTVTNLPAFAVHNEPTSDFTIPQNANLNLIGEYTVTLRSEIRVPNDYTGTTFTTKFVQYNFVIQVEECVVNTYKANQIITVISYNVGAPTLVSPKYSFDEEPACYYPETVTVKNLPPFATHDEAASEFTIAKNTDLSIIGSYTVTLRSEISVPTDYTKTSFTKKFVEYDFLILIEPCLVNSYVATTTVTEILYNIGAPSKTDGRYGFDEAPVCNYPEKVTVTNLPAFAKHNPATSDFTVPQTTDLALLGEYIVTLRSEICVPNDHTKAACKTMFVEYDFRILVGPCIVNTYTDTKRVGDISYNIGAPSLVNVGKYIFQESPVCNYPETVTLTNLPAFIKHQEPTSDFTLPQNTDLALIGSYVVTIRSSISKPDDYRGATFTQMFVEYTFTIFVEPCLVTSYVATLEVADIRYNIGGASLLNVSPYIFDEAPVCNYPETVTLTNLPTFARHNAPASDDFSLPKTANLALLGAYTVKIKSQIEVPNDHTKTSFKTWSAEHEFVIYIEPCLVASYDATTIVTVIVYNVNQPTLTAGHYQFDETPVCKYPETVTVTNLPAFAVHNEPTSDFTIPQNANLNLIGEYTVTLRSEIRVPNDYTGTTFTTKFVQYNFVIQVEECVVNTYKANQIITVISYNVGAPTLVSPKYSFDEEPACYYPETVTVKNLPPFATHDEAASEFTIAKNTDLSIIGSYTVTLRSEISVPTDYTKTSFTKKFVEYDFLILIEPCLVNSYVATTTVTEILYNIGAPSKTDGRYGFDEAPVCNYPEKVTVTNLPVFAKHNPATSDFTVPQTTDLALLGEYIVTLRSEICVPNDHTKATCKTMFVEYDFRILVNPCIVNTYTDTKRVGDISYNIGAPSLINVGKYIFQESPVCNYPETVTLTNLPAFIKHQEPTSDFTLPQNTDLALIGSYVVTIRSSISKPDDYRGATFTQMFVEYTFTIFVEPCLVTSYVATLEVEDIRYNIGGASLLNVSPYIFDEAPVCNYPETVTLTNLPTFARHNAPASDDFSLPKTANLALLGAYTVKIKSQIEVPNDHTKTSFKTWSAEHEFVIYMEPCLVASYDATTIVTVIVYNVNQPTLTAGHYQFDETPVCKYPETVTVTNLPAFAVHNEPTSDFTIPQNANLNLIGDYTVTLRSEIRVPNDYTGTTFTTKFVEYNFVIQVEECVVNTYKANQIITVISYNVGAPTLVSPKYSFDEEPACYYPETVTVKNLPPFATHDEAASEFTIAKNTDLSIIGSYTVTLRSEISVPTDYTKTSFTKKFVEYDFLILIEPCLVNSYVATTTVTEILYNIGAPSKTDGRYGFDEAPVCNYPEKVTVTNLPVFAKHNPATSDFTVPQTTDLTLLGEYIVTLRSEICVPNDHTKAACKTMFVEYDFRILVNPCIVNTYTDAKRVGDISYNIGAPSLVNVGKYIFQESPVCNYPETVTLTNLPAFIKHQEPTSDFTLLQNTDLALIGSYVVTIRSSISKPDDYRGATFTQMFVEYTFTIFVEPCLVTSYVATLEVADIRYNIGGASLLNVSPYIFDEAPVCNYPETVTLTNLPTFARHNAPALDDFSLPKTADLALLGAYTVKIKSQIEVPNDHTKTSFKTWSAEHEFVIYMEPCLVASYDATTIVTVIVYNVNQLTLTAGHYQFDETPVCKYPETVTVKNLPAFAVHNEPTSDFTIPQNANLNLIGEYTVTLRSEIRVPNDYTGTTFTTKFVEYNFVIQVEECLVSTYTADQKITKISYNIGAPDLTSMKYSFVENPPCSYPETVFLTNLPAFVNLNEGTSDFTIPKNQNLSILGSYTVTLRSEIYIPNDYTKSTFRTMVAQFDFVIYIEPCLVSTYEASTRVSLIVYNVGQPSLTDGYYDFKESPVCNYPEFVKLTNLPGFVQHNDLSSDFTVPENHDLAIIGGYTVRIRSEIRVPNDYTNKTFTIMFAEYDFFVQIEECIINAYEVSQKMQTLTYIIGDPDFFSAPYSFDETPVCNYPEIVTVTNLPSFATHRESDSNFKIAKNENLALDGTYTVTLRSEIHVPTDYTKTVFTTWYKEYTFDIVMIDPCKTSTIDDFTVPDMAVSVKSGFKTQAIEDPTDLVSRKYGNLDGFSYCGLREFEITTLPTRTYSNFLGFDPSANLFTFGTTAQSDVGVYELDLRAYLVEYPNVELVKKFKIKIIWCQVTDLQPTPVTRQTYDVYTPAIQFSTVDFVQTPLCGYDLEYEYRIKNIEKGTYTPLPSWLKQVSHLSFDVFTMDPTSLGKYYISVIGKVPAMYMDLPYEEELIIELRVKDGCEDDQVTNLSVVADTLYNVAEDGLVRYMPTWSHSEEGCPIEYLVSRVVGGVERPLSADEETVLKHFNTTGWLDLETSDYALDGEVWTIRLFMRSSFSKSPLRDGAHIFDIEFRDICWDSKLLAASFEEAFMLYEVWQMQSNLFTKMVDASQGALCGGYTHQLIYLDGPKLDYDFGPFNADLSPFTLLEVSDTAMEMAGAVQDFSWLGTHKIVIRSTNGKADGSDTARGTGGLFKSVDSDPIQIKIVNPCLRSVVNEDLGLKIPDLVVPGGQVLLAMVYPGPTDSVSVTYGNGYDRCGNLTYKWFDAGGDVFENSYFSSNFTIVDRGADNLQQNLTSTATGTTLYDYLTLVVSLKDYPASTPATFKVKLEYRECFPFNFRGPQIGDISMKVGQPGPDIDYFFNQAPCSWNQTYEIEVTTVTGRSETFPAFMEADGTLVIIKAPQASDAGTYKFKICSQIQNSLSTRECTNFQVDVQPLSTANITVSIKPEWLVNLSNQRVKVGHNLLYSPGIQMNTYGYMMEVKAELGDAFRFSEYDQVANIFRVHSGLTVKEDVGDYMIMIQARFFNETYDEKFSGHFWLTVWDDPITIEQWMPPDPIEYQYWKMPIKDSMEMEPFDPLRPIPYVKSLTQTGVMTIAWDKTMVPPGNYTFLPQAQVAVRAWEDILAEVRVANTQSAKRQLERVPQFTPAPTQGYRRRDTNTLVWFADYEDLYYEKMKLLDALEIKILPEDRDFGVTVDFDWDILGYDEKYIWLQLYIRNPWEVAADGQFDTIYVTFWGTEYFKSINNKEVRYGTTIEHQIFRQINPSAAKGIDEMNFSKGMAFFSFVIILPFVSIGSLLPTWMFINALQLAAHLPLLNSIMPGNAHYFLNEYLDLVRWYDKDFIQKFDEYWDVKKYDVNVGALHELLHASGYEHLTAHNTILVFFGIALILLVWLIFAAKDLIQRKLKSERAFMKRRHEPWCCNFFVRYFYEFFLEFCIVVFINLSVADFSQFSPSFSYFAALVLLVLILCLIAILVALLFCGGPYVPHYFSKGTVLQSLWGLRPVDPTFDSSAYLKANRKEQKKKRGWYKFVVGGKKHGKVLPLLIAEQSVGASGECGPGDFTNHPIGSHGLTYSRGCDSPQKDSQPKEKEANESPLNTMRTDRNFLVTPIATPRLPGLRGSFNNFAMPTIYSKNSNVPQTQVGTFDEQNNYDDFPYPDVIDLDRSAKKGEAKSKPALQQKNKDEIRERHPFTMKHKNKWLSNASDANIEGLEQRSPLNSMKVAQKRVQAKQDFEGGQLDTQMPMIDEYMELRHAAKVAQKHKRQRLMEERIEHAAAMRQQAKLAIELADSVQEPERIKTLYYGLKRNHPRNVAVIHPLMFVVRRIVYAAMIVGMDQVPLFATHVFMFMTLVMLGFVLSEHQWKDRVINQQHIFNEIILYCLSVVMLTFTNFVSPLMRYIMGFVLITLVFVFVIYNAVIMLLFSCKFFILIIRKQYYRLKRRDLGREAKTIAQKIQVGLDNAPPNEVDWFSPKELAPQERFGAQQAIEEEVHTEEKKKQPPKLKVFVSRTFCGGLTGALMPQEAQELSQHSEKQSSLLQGHSKRNQVHHESETSRRSERLEDNCSVGNKDMKQAVSESNSMRQTRPQLGVDCVDDSSRVFRNHSLRPSAREQSSCENEDGMHLNIHTFSPNNSILASLMSKSPSRRTQSNRGQKNEEQKERSLEEEVKLQVIVSSDDSGDSKAYFEPDEVSLASCPHELNGPGMSCLQNGRQALLDKKKLNTTRQFFKPSPLTANKRQNGKLVKEPDHFNEEASALIRAQMVQDLKNISSMLNRSGTRSTSFCNTAGEHVNDADNANANSYLQSIQQQLNQSNSDLMRQTLMTALLKHKLGSQLGTSMLDDKTNRTTETISREVSAFIQEEDDPEANQRQQDLLGLILLNMKPDSSLDEAVLRTARMLEQQRGEKSALVDHVPYERSRSTDESQVHDVGSSRQSPSISKAVARSRRTHSRRREVSAPGSPTSQNQLEAVQAAKEAMDSRVNANDPSQKRKQLKNRSRMHKNQLQQPLLERLAVDRSSDMQSVQVCHPHFESMPFEASPRALTQQRTTEHQYHTSSTAPRLIRNDSDEEFRRSTKPISVGDPDVRRHQSSPRKNEDKSRHYIPKQNNARRVRVSLSGRISQRQRSIADSVDPESIRNLSQKQRREHVSRQKSFHLTENGEQIIHGHSSAHSSAATCRRHETCDQILISAKSAVSGPRGHGPSSNQKNRRKAKASEDNHGKPQASMKRTTHGHPSVSDHSQFEQQNQSLISADNNRVATGVHVPGQAEDAGSDAEKLVENFRLKTSNRLDASRSNSGQTDSKEMAVNVHHQVLHQKNADMTSSQGISQQTRRAPQQHSTKKKTAPNKLRSQAEEFSAQRIARQTASGYPVASDHARSSADQNPSLNTSSDRQQSNSDQTLPFGASVSSALVQLPQQQVSRQKISDTNLSRQTDPRHQRQLEASISASSGTGQTSKEATNERTRHGKQTRSHDPEQSESEVSAVLQQVPINTQSDQRPRAERKQTALNKSNQNDGSDVSAHVKLENSVSVDSEAHEHRSLPNRNEHELDGQRMGKQIAITIQHEASSDVIQESSMQNSSLVEQPKLIGASSHREAPQTRRRKLFSFKDAETGHLGLINSSDDKLQSCKSGTLSVPTNMIAGMMTKSKTAKPANSQAMTASALRLAEANASARRRKAKNEQKENKRGQQVRDEQDCEDNNHRNESQLSSSVGRAIPLANHNTVLSRNDVRDEKRTSSGESVGTPQKKKQSDLLLSQVPKSSQTRKKEPFSYAQNSLNQQALQNSRPGKQGQKQVGSLTSTDFREYENLLASNTQPESQKPVQDDYHSAYGAVGGGHRTLMRGLLNEGSRAEIRFESNNFQDVVEAKQIRRQTNEHLDARHSLFANKEEEAMTPLTIALIQQTAKSLQMQQQHYNCDSKNDAQGSKNSSYIPSKQTRPAATDDELTPLTAALNNINFGALPQSKTSVQSVMAHGHLKQGPIKTDHHQNKHSAASECSMQDSFAASCNVIADTRSAFSGTVHQMLATQQAPKEQQAQWALQKKGEHRGTEVRPRRGLHSANLMSDQKLLSSDVKGLSSLNLQSPVTVMTLDDGMSGQPRQAQDALVLEIQNKNQRSERALGKQNPIVMQHFGSRIRHSASQVINQALQSPRQMLDAGNKLALMYQPGMRPVIEEDSLDPQFLEAQVIQFQNSLLHSPTLAQDVRHLPKNSREEPLQERKTHKIDRKQGLAKHSSANPVDASFDNMLKDRMTSHADSKDAPPKFSKEGTLRVGCESVGQKSEMTVSSAAHTVFRGKDLKHESSTARLGTVLMSRRPNHNSSSTSRRTVHDLGKMEQIRLAYNQQKDNKGSVQTREKPAHKHLKKSVHKRRKHHQGAGAIVSESVDRSHCQMISSPNRVFNINVVTEDGQTRHEDYPHEIDPTNYPQLSPERFKNSRNALAGSMHALSSFEIQKNQKMIGRGSLSKVQSMQDAIRYGSIGLDSNDTVSQAYNRGENASAHHVLPKSTGESEFNLYMNVLNARGSFDTGSIQAGYSDETRNYQSAANMRDSAETMNYQPGVNSRDSVQMSNYQPTTNNFPSQGSNFNQFMNGSEGVPRIQSKPQIRGEVTRSIHNSVESNLDNKSQLSSVQRGRLLRGEFSAERDFRRNVARNVLENIPKVNEQLHQSVDRSKLANGNLNYSFAPQTVLSAERLPRSQRRQNILQTQSQMDESQSRTNKRNLNKKDSFIIL